MGDLVAGALDINGASPRRHFLEVLSAFSGAEAEADRLQYFASPEGREDLYAYNQREGLQLIKSAAGIQCAGWQSVNSVEVVGIQHTAECLLCLI